MWVLNEVFCKISYINKYFSSVLQNIAIPCSCNKQLKVICINVGSVLIYKFFMIFIQVPILSNDLLNHRSNTLQLFWLLELTQLGCQFSLRYVQLSLLILSKCLKASKQNKNKKNNISIKGCYRGFALQIYRGLLTFK